MFAIVRADEMNFVFEFPATTGLDANDVEPYVEMLHSTIEHRVPDDLLRCVISRANYGEANSISMRIKDPRVDLQYGFAPPELPKCFDI